MRQHGTVQKAVLGLHRTILRTVEYGNVGTISSARVGTRTQSSSSATKDPCVEWGQWFTQVGHLAFHKRQHGEEEPFECVGTVLVNII